MTQRPILYSFRRCPYAIRARMALQAGQCAVELREVVLKHKPQEFLDSSPKATVPVLVLANGVVLDESLDIMRWALENSAKNALLAADGWWGHKLIANNDGDFKRHLDHYKYADRFPEASECEYRDKAVPYLLDLNRLLRQQLYLSGPSVGVLDVAIFPFIRQFAAVDPEWFEASELSFLRRWLNGHLQSELFLSVMRKYKPWCAGAEVQVFPES